VSNKKSLSILLLAVTSLIWGSSFILIKRGLLFFSPFEVGSLRIFIAFLIFLPVAIMGLKKINKEDWPLLGLSGLLGSLFPSLLFSFAGSKLDSSVSGTLNAVTPIFTMLVSLFFFGHRIKWLNAFGILVGFIGAVALALKNTSNGVSFEVNFYAMLVVLATLFYALNVNLLKTRLSHIPPVQLSAITIFFAGLPAGIILFGFTDFTQHFDFSTEAIQALGFVAILSLGGTAIALVLFNKLIQISNAVVASSVTYIMPVVALAWGILDDEIIYPTQYFGVGAVLVGVYLVNKKPKIQTL